MNAPAPDIDELHAYADGQLPEARRAAVEAWLAAHPEAAGRVRGWRADAEALRAAWQAQALPAAPRLEPARIARRLRAERWNGFARAAMLVLTLGLGGAGGWWLHDARQAQPAAPPMADAMSAYRLFADSPDSLDFRGDRAGALQDWLGRHFAAVGRLPDLSSQGYSLQGARLLSTAEGAAAMLVYRDAAGATVGVYVRPRSPRMREGRRREGGLEARYWAQGDAAIAVVASRFDPRAGAVAPLVRRGG